MKHGLGEIQQYFTGINDIKQPFWDGSSADKFFGGACEQYQSE